MNTACFLDRDGTLLVQESGKYLTSLEEACFEIGAMDALISLSKRFDKLIIVTNQAGIGTGEVEMRDVLQIHEWMQEAVTRRGGHLDGLYVCPHRKDSGCKCRKPGIGLYEKAVAEHRIIVEQSVGIGDSFNDIMAYRRMNLTPVLVLTGKGRQAIKELDHQEPFHLIIAEDLYSYAYGIDCKETHGTQVHDQAVRALNRQDRTEEG